MPTSLYRTVRSRRPTVALPVALAVLFVLGPATGIVSAQEATTLSNNSAKIVVQESTAAGGSSGKSGAPGDVEVSAGEAIAGDAYAGNGCARAGDVTAGDCDEEASGGGSRNSRSSDGPSDNSRQPEEDEETNAPETTAAEVTREETTLLEDTAGDETTSTASPDPAATALCPSGPPKDAVEATIEDATDGDTVELAGEVDGHDTVRLIGVDTPEREDGDGRPEPLAEGAAGFTAEELEGREVLLQIGAEEADEYGRLLAYVWTAPEGGIMGSLRRMVGMAEAELFNRRLVEEGYAEALTVEPNDLYAECFEAAERDAREAGVGIWADNESSAGPSRTQHDDQTTPETTIEDASPPGTEPLERTLTENASGQASRGGDETIREGPERLASPTQAQYELAPPAEASPPEREIRDEGTQDPEVQGPEDQESVAPSGGGEAAVLENPAGPETGASPSASAGTSASPGPASALPTEAVPNGSLPTLPETGGLSLLPLSLGIAALLGGTAMGFLAVRTLLGRTHPDRR